ncbi:hypothetical protein LJC05_00565 [Bacteroides sp. OttesenSCG-928-J23]|nr:hypothetical protein [Bacteroides sp. OttesenSCG-928-J23]MDL2303790.1 hypothetical protein [Bacteroides sp. OttesenSCG-928-D19]
MKKLLLLLFVVSTLVACEEFEGPMGPEGPQGAGMNWNVENFVVRANEWVRFENKNNPKDVYYKCVKEPKYENITAKERNFIYTDGTLMAYMYLIDPETKKEVQTPLPYVVNWSNYYEETQMEVFYFDYTADDIAFYCAISGEGSEEKAPGEVEFRVVMNW